MSLPRFSVNNQVLVNMIMLVTLVAGGAFALTLVREMFPESRADSIMIVAAYPATQPEELEKAVTIKIEEAVRDVEGVEKVNSTVSEGLSSTTLTLYNEVDDVDAVLQEVKNEVDAIADLPDDLERITVAKAEPTLPVIMVALHGEGDEADLKRAARNLRDEILLLPGVSDVTMSGVRDDEISVELRPDKLLEYDITFAEVAQAIRATNLDISGGNLKGDRSQVSVRTLGEELEGKDLENIEVKTLTDGAVVRVADVATVIDRFVDSDQRSYFMSEPSVNLIVQKTSDQDAIQISNLVQAFVKGKQGAPYDPWGMQDALAQPWYARPFSILNVKASMILNKMAGRPDPEAIYERSRLNPFDHNFKVDMHTDLARFVRGRLDLMLRNGKAGLILVVICLNLFLNWRVAWWTAIGLPVSFLGTFVAMYVLGSSINLLSMFALIVVLGIIVDDAIVIGENIYRLVEEGMPAREAAVKGAEEVLWPVTVAVLTTIAAFAPMLFITGTIGDFMRELPIVVMAALSVSLVEALVILPAHLAHLPAKKVRQQMDAEKQWWDPRRIPDVLMGGFLQPIYARLVETALRWRYVTVGVCVGTCMAVLGLFVGFSSDGKPTIGNVVRWEFIQKMDAESMYANIEMPVGTTAAELEKRMRQLSDVAVEMPEVSSVQMDVANSFVDTGRGGMDGAPSSHLGVMWVELLEADEREKLNLRSSEAVLAEFRKASEQLKGVNSVKWETMNGGPGGKDIEIRLSGGSFEDLLVAAEELKQELDTYAGVADLDDDFNSGKRELRVTLRQSARPTGITVAGLGSQIREATYGAEARRLTRNREDVKIMVRYPESYRKDVAHIESMYIPTAGTTGQRGWVPISEVADIEESSGFDTIRRAQQKRAVTVSGEVDRTVNEPSEVLRQLREAFVPKLIEKYPALRVEYLGAAENQAKSFAGLKIAFPVALLMVYMLLAGLFRSYFQPIVVMSVIPFGVQGAIIGHWITGNPFTFLSAIGLVALTGILVNDSLVLVDFINSRVRAGLQPLEASVEGAKLRLRPIVLTTLTTAAGLTPLMFETSFQAKFLIPMAVTLTFGLVFATVLTLIMVPAMNMIFMDLFHRVRHGESWLDNESTSESARKQRTISV